jgi:hypothetical protein
MIGAAAANNALWCDLVCRSHGITPEWADDAWTSSTRTPPLYPDAVSLHPAADLTGLLARIDASAGCSVKDSFSCLDPAPHGFGVLFEAQWMVAPARHSTASPMPPGWILIRHPADLARWEEAWAGPDAPRGLFSPRLLQSQEVAIAARREDGVVTQGAVFNRGADVVGVTNVFGRASTEALPWSDCIAVAASVFPGLALVGYESGQRLDEATGQGFEPAGLLRVLTRPG